MLGIPYVGFNSLEAAPGHLFRILVMDPEDNQFEEEEEEEETPEMPTNRLADIVKAIEEKEPTVINLDAAIKSTELEILKWILQKLPRSVSTVSLRFNNLGSAGAEIIVEWLQDNDHVQVLYLMGTGIDNKARDAIDTVWKKKLRGHRVDNNGYTFIRVDPSIEPLKPFDP